MGVLPLQFAEGTDAQTLGLDGSETFSFSGIDEVSPGKTVLMTIKRAERRDGDGPATPAHRYAPSRSITTSTAAFCRIVLRQILA